jgi:protein-L-isoaspartate O-methyltransferase
MSPFRPFHGRPQYAPHVPEHDRMYERPECQADLRRLREMLTELLAGRRVLEIACGTGYWTQHVAEVAQSVLALDVNEDLLKLAMARLRHFSNTAVLLDDAFTLSTIADTFDAGFAAFWWNHVPRQQLPAFLDTFHAKLHPGALVTFVDSRADVSHIASRTDDAGNTYQRHHLADGAEHEVICNFPTREELEQTLRPRSRMLTIHEFPRYWCATYQLPSRTEFTL